MIMSFKAVRGLYPSRLFYLCMVHKSTIFFQKDKSNRIFGHMKQTGKMKKFSGLVSMPFLFLSAGLFLQ